MNDDKFNEIMNKYVSSTGRSADNDLAKLRNSEKVSRQVRKKRYAWSAVAAILVIAVTLATVLPLTLGKGSQSEGDGYLYCDETQVEFVEMHLQDVLELGNFSLLPMAFENPISEQHYAMILRESDAVIGSMSRYTIYRELMDEVNVFALKDKYIYSQTQVIFDECKLNSNWREKNVRYIMVEIKNSGSYEYSFVFNDNGMNYYVKAIVYGTPSPETVLDNIFA